jgi:hemerythrin-like domain-containing protein
MASRMSMPSKPKQLHGLTAPRPKQPRGPPMTLDPDRSKTRPTARDDAGTESARGRDPGTKPVIIDVLRQEHRNIEKLLLVLEQELKVFARGERPDYEVIQAVIAYFQVYPDLYHHPPEDLVFEKLKARDSNATSKIGDLEVAHRAGSDRLRRVAQAIESVLADRDLVRQGVSDIIRDFIERERQHIAMEERDFFPAAVKALRPQDWTEIASRLTDQKDPLFSENVERRFESVRRHIIQLEQEAQADRSGALC